MSSTARFISTNGISAFGYAQQSDTLDSRFPVPGVRFATTAWCHCIIFQPVITKSIRYCQTVWIIGQDRRHMESVFFSAVCFRKEFVKTSLAKQEQCWCHKVHSKDVHPKDKRSSVILYQTIIKCHILYQTIIKWQAHNVLVLCSTPWQKTNGRHTVHVLIHVLHGTPREDKWQSNSVSVLYRQMAKYKWQKHSVLMHAPHNTPREDKRQTHNACTNTYTTHYTPKRQMADTQRMYHTVLPEKTNDRHTTRVLIHIPHTTPRKDKWQTHSVRTNACTTQYT